MKTLVVGLGNPILGDDGIGWKVAEELKHRNEIPSDVTIECMAIGGIGLMESLIGYDRAILIDAIITNQSPIGSVKYFKLEDLPNLSSGHISSAHDTSLENALALGQSAGAYLPNEISVISIEAQKVYDFSDEMTPPVVAAVPEAVRIVLNLLIESKLNNSSQNAMTTS